MICGVSAMLVRNYAHDERFSADIELLFVIEGSLTLRFSGVDRVLVKNDIFLVNSGLVCSAESSDDALVCTVSYSCELVASEMGKGYDYVFFCDSARDETRSYTQIRSILRELSYQLVLTHHKSSCMKDSVALKLLNVLFEDHLQEYSFLPSEKPEGDTRLRMILGYVQENYADTISLHELANSMFLSASALSRFFKHATGMKFADYVAQVRMKHAVEDLLYSNKNMTRIAVDAGYSNISVFNKNFKATFGMSPSEYRRQHSQDAIEDANTASALVEQVRHALSFSIEESWGYAKVISEYAVVNVKTGTPRKKDVVEILNVGEAKDLLRSHICSHVEFLLEHPGFRYVRIWSVFSREMTITDGVHPGNYHYDRLDEVLDFLVAHHALPFLDLSSRPRTSLVLANEPAFYEESNTLFASKEVWCSAMEDLLHHICRRYGRYEVSKWIFELTHDPHHAEERCYEDPHYSFFEAWRYLYGIVKKELPQVQFGGPTASCYGDETFIRDFLRCCKKEDCVPDFVSFLLFPYTTEEQKDAHYHRRAPDPSFEFDRVLHMRRILAEEEISSELFVTEWNNSISARNFLNDSCYRAAYIARYACELKSHVDMLGIWMASDWISDFWDSSGIANGGTGLLTKDTIPKPAYHALMFVRSLGEILLKVHPHFIASRDARGEFYILCSNYKFYSLDYLTKEDRIAFPQDTDLAFDDADPVDLTLSLSGLDEGIYAVKRRKIGSDTANILNEWEKFGYDVNLEAKDVAYIRQSCYPRLSMEKIDVKDGTLRLSLSLEPHEVSLLHIYRYRE